MDMSVREGLKEGNATNRAEWRKKQISCTGDNRCPDKAGMEKTMKIKTGRWQRFGQSTAYAIWAAEIVKKKSISGQEDNSSQRRQGNT